MLLRMDGLEKPIRGQSALKRYTCIFVTIVITPNVLNKLPWCVTEVRNGGPGWARDRLSRMFRSERARILHQIEKGFCSKNISVYSATVFKNHVGRGEWIFGKHTNSRAKLKTVPRIAITSTAVKFHVHGLSNVAIVLFEETEPPA